MKVGVYNEPCGGSIGGSEASVAVLAEALAARHEVEIVHHRPSLTARQLAEHAAADLSAVSLRYAAPEPYSFGESRNPWRRYREALAWHAGLSRPYDLFVSFIHGLPPFCRAPAGVLMVLFPLYERPEVGRAGTDRLKRAYHDYEWARRMGSYQLKLANSEYTRRWSRRRWGIDPRVLYPPVDARPPAADKADLILSVGRFATEGHSKKQLEMASAFCGLRRAGLQDWKYYCVGGLGDSPADRAYFEEVERTGAGCGARVLANVERGLLDGLYGRAKVFWHAAGYGEGEERPELAEHFGTVTVEAMAAGCVPVVIDKGGQSEIVRHGVDGFLWRTLDELAEYTTLLVRDEALRAQLALAARERAATFGRKQFVDGFTALLAPLL